MYVWLTVYIHCFTTYAYMLYITHKHTILMLKVFVIFCDCVCRYVQYVICILHIYGYMCRHTCVGECTYSRILFFFCHLSNPTNCISIGHTSSYQCVDLPSLQTEIEGGGVVELQ